MTVKVRLRDEEIYEQLCARGIVMPIVLLRVLNKNVKVEIVKWIDYDWGQETPCVRPVMPEILKRFQ